MAAIKPLEAIAEKYTRVTPGRAADYEAGVRDPAKDWETETRGAEKAWEAGVQGAITRKAFSRGVAAAGTKKWQEKAIEKGVPRWPEGVRLAGDDYRTGFAPYHDVIARTTLPPRYPVGDPRNIERVAKIAKALFDKRVGTSK